MEATIDGTSWFSLNTNGITDIDDRTHKIQFRWNGQGSSFDLQRFEVELHGSGLPSSPSIDLLGDGRHDWGITNQSIGTWGWQDVLENGNYSIDLKFPGQHTIPLWIPKDSLGDFIFEISPEITSGVTNLHMDFKLNTSVLKFL